MTTPDLSAALAAALVTRNQHDNRWLWLVAAVDALYQTLAPGEMPESVGVAARTPQGELLYLTTVAGDQGRVRRQLVTENADTAARIADWVTHCTTDLTAPDTPEGLTTDG